MVSKGRLHMYETRGRIRERRSVGTLSRSHLYDRELSGSTLRISLKMEILLRVWQSCQWGKKAILLQEGKDEKPHPRLAPWLFIVLFVVVFLMVLHKQGMCKARKHRILLYLEWCITFG